jgi:hypothetical protein
MVSLGVSGLRFRIVALLATYHEFSELIFRRIDNRTFQFDLGLLMIKQFFDDVRARFIAICERSIGVSSSFNREVNRAACCAWELCWNSIEIGFA